MERGRIAIIGAGNVATHLARALDRKARVVQVCSRNIEHAARLASALRDCKPTDDASTLDADCDYYIISVCDDAIEPVSMTLPDTDGIVVHTSGSTPIDKLARHQRRGVLYPLQTFSAAAELDIQRVPFFIEGSDDGTRRKIKELAQTLSPSVYEADSEQRAALHIAAVFACNFTNHLLEIAVGILHDNGYPLTVLQPLLEVTLHKAMLIGPHGAQTGPAVRRDMGVINRHLSALASRQAEIYRLLTQSIMERHK